MLKSYAAIYENSEVQWPDDKPTAQSARLIVTIVEEKTPPTVNRRFPPDAIAGKGKTLGDIVSPMVN